jgi:methionyl-tRNA formyltransferase
LTTEQEHGVATSHRKEDFVDLWQIDPDETVRAGDFLDRLRALTFPPFNNAYFEENGDRYYVDVSITHEEDIDEHAGRVIPAYSKDDIP